MARSNKPIESSITRKGQKRTLITEGMIAYNEKYNQERFFEKIIDRELSEVILQNDEDYDRLLELRKQLEIKYAYIKNPLYQRFIDAQLKYVTLFEKETKKFIAYRIAQLLHKPTEYNILFYKKSAKKLFRLMTVIFNSCKKNNFPEETFSSELKNHSITMRKLNDIIR